MSPGPVDLEFTDGIATLTLCRPHVRNAIDFATADAIEAALTRVEVDDNIRALVLTGSGPVFSSGGDLRLFSTLRTESQVRDMCLRLAGMVQRLAEVPVPAIAALQGPAIGGGAELSLACDVRVMASTAYLQFPQTRFGIITGWGGGQRLRQILGHARASEILFSGERVTATDAVRIGLANAMFDSDFGQAVDGYARMLCGGTRAANAAMKRALLVGYRVPPEEAIAAEMDMFVDRWLDPERSQRMAHLMPP